MRQFVRSPIGISLLLSLVLWLTGDCNDIVGHAYWNVAHRAYDQQAPKSIVLITVDDVADFDNNAAARLLTAVRKQMPKRVFFDHEVSNGLDRRGDENLARAFKSLGRDLTLVVRGQKFDVFQRENFRLPPQSIAGIVPIALSAWNSNSLNFVVSAPYQVKLGDKVFPTLSAELAGVVPGWQRLYHPDFFVDPTTVQKVLGHRLLDGQVPPGVLTGRNVVITSLGQAGVGGYFGHQSYPLIMHDVAGAYALMKPFSVDLTLAPLLLLALLGIWLGSQMKPRRIKFAIHGATVLIVLAIPVACRTIGIVIGPEGAIVMMMIYGVIRMWQKRMKRVQQTNASGLPNLIALSASNFDVGRDVVVVVIARYEEMLAVLPENLHGECALQIARRLSIDSKATDIYQGDGGHFGWSEEARPLERQLDHLEGLRALFAAPLLVGEHTFDTNIHFGLDRNEGIDRLTRVNSAVASANEALSNGRAIELFEAKRLAEAPWELSLHARIEEGLQNGDIWLAFQSQWDFESKSVTGAEALIRWDHPTRGPIAPDAFILQAERAGRIDTLTYWVLEQAITAALEINALGPRFQMSINLSAQMVDKPDLVANFVEITRRRGIDPGLLTIEITETSSVSNRPAACYNLTQLRALGFRLSIDDFGTGEASLTYLADLPSDELKLDRQFIARLLTSDRDRAIVMSTIALAHALGQSVVAEGIEDAATLEMLGTLGCDSAQGYFLGRPQPFAAYVAEYRAGMSRRYGVV